MKLRGMTAEDVDVAVDAFDELMQQGMKKACAAASSHAMALTAAGEPASDGALSSIIDGLSVMTTQWEQFVTGTLMPMLVKMATKAAEAIGLPLGNVPAIKTEEFIGDMENHVKGFSADMWDAAKASLIAGAQDGESIAQLAARIESVADVKAKKARVVAQTTVIAAINGGEWKQMMEAASAFDVAGIKEWEATEDSHTRPTHAAADGQRVPIDAHFIVGGSMLLFPGDPSGAPEEIISCRCTTLYDLDVNEDSLTAAVDHDFNKEHPRGKDGKFIKKGVGLPGELVNDIIALKGGKGYEDIGAWGSGEKEDFVNDLKKITAKQWANLKDEDKEALTKHVDALVDEGVPGSATASMHLDDLEGGDQSSASDVFNPNTPLPVSSYDPVADLALLKKQYDKGLMTKDEYEFEKANIEAGKPTPSGQPIIPPNSYTGPAPTTTAEYHAAVSTITTGNATPLKITHGLIHAKHTPGTVIAQGDDGSKITWNGSEYELTDGETGTSQSIKKSKLYAKLNDGYYKTVKWHTPGKQETEVTHATPLDAAPAPEPIPHPVGISSFPKPSAVDTALDDAFGTDNDLKTKITAAYFDNKIDEAQFSELTGHLNNGTMSSAEVQKKLDEYTPSVPDSLPDVSDVGNQQYALLLKKLNDGTINKDQFNSVVDTIKKVYGPKPDEDKYTGMWDSNDLNDAQLAQLNKLYDQYSKGLMTQDEAYQQINLIKNGPTTPASSGDYGITIPPGTPLLHEDLLDVFNVAKNGDTIAVGTTPAGTKYELKKLSAAKFNAVNTENGIENWLTANELKNVTTSNNVTWKTPGGPSVPAAAPSIPSATDVSAVTPKATDVPYKQKWAFYNYFKAEKVSPAWSGAKIYASAHAAKTKMAGDPSVAGLSDDELLKLLDIAEFEKNGKANAYSQKVKDWLKTPNGQKAFKQLNPAIPTGPAPTKSTPTPTKSTWDTMYENTVLNNPVNNPPPISFGPAAKKVAKKAAKKVAAKKAAASPGITAEEALGDTTVDPLLDASNVFASFKNANYGKYLSDKPEHIYWNAVQQSKNVAHSTPGSILALVDEQSAKKFGVANEQKYTEKVKAWLKTPTGKVKAAEIKAGTYSPGFANPASSSSYGSSGFGSSYSHPSTTPINEKVGPPLQQVEEFDPSKGYDWKKSASKDFPTISHSKAQQMVDAWSADQGAMTATQKSALKKYTGSSYDPMNEYLRGYSGATDQTHKDVQNAQAGMRLSLEPVTLHRGNGWFKGWSSVEEVKSHLGEDFHQAAFFSSSIGGKSAFSGPINFVIECPPGTPMAYVKTFSNFGGEDEMLLGANLNYRVVEVIEGNSAPDNSQHYNTKVTVRLRVIPPSDTAAEVDTTPTA